MEEDSKWEEDIQYQYRAIRSSKLGSPTTTKIIGVEKLMPSVLWTRNVLEAQVYRVTGNIVYKDQKALFFWRII